MKAILRFASITLLIWTCLTLSVRAVDEQPNLRRVCVSASRQDVVLNWIPVQDACGSFIAYDIYFRQTPSDPFQLLTSITNINTNTYTHSGVYTFSKTWEYFIIVRSDCSGNPTQSSDTVAVDNQMPSLTSIDSVSVDPLTGLINIGWKMNPTADIWGYFIYDALNNPYALVTDTFFQVDFLSTKDSAHVFNIAAFDSCGNVTAIVNPHTTMLLTGQYNTCQGSIDLAWTAYGGWSGIQRYDVMMNKNSTGYISVASLPGNTLNYSITGLLPGDQVAVFIRAVDSADPSISSSSNGLTFVFPSIPRPLYNYLNRVSVLDNGQVELRWVRDTLAEINSFRILRSTNGIQFDTIATTTVAAGPNQTYVDTRVQTDKNIYYYQILPFDNCDNFTGSYSNVSNTILLQLTRPNGIDNVLSWNQYAWWPGGALYYYIFRGIYINGAYSWELIGSANPGDSTFTDTDLPLVVGNTGICYQVIANEGVRNGYGLQDTSFSNIKCDVREMTVYFPSAFNPYGLNRFFKPGGTYIDYDKSNMFIFNRWGQIIGNVDNLRVGWSGKKCQGNEVCSDFWEEGVYYFQANLTGTNKMKKQISGSFLLIR